MTSLAMPPNQLGLHAAGTLPTAAAFLCAILVLDYFDISLPKGERIGASGALSAAAVFLVGPVWAAAASLAGLGLAHVIRLKTLRGKGLLAAILSRAVALAVCGRLFNAFERAPALWVALAAAALAPALFLLTELVITQLAVAAGSSRPLGRLLWGNLSGQAPLLAAEWSASLLLLITYGKTGNWSLVPVSALLLLTYQSYALLLDVRETYRTTIEVLVEAAEGQDERRSGHADRTATIARAIAMQSGFSTAQVELISLAALVHDVGAIGGQRIQDSLQSPSGNSAVSSGPSSAVLNGVGFFQGVVPILRLCEGDQDLLCGATEMELSAALVVALASDAGAANDDLVAATHQGSVVGRVAPYVSPAIKSRTVAAALALGYKTSAVN